MFHWISMRLREGLEMYRRRKARRAKRYAALLQARKQRLVLEGLEERQLLSALASLPLPAPTPLGAMAAAPHAAAPTQQEIALPSHHFGSALTAGHDAVTHPAKHHERREHLTPSAGPDGIQPPPPLYYYWIPQNPQKDDNASNGQNWVVNGQRGTVPNAPNAVVVFDGQLNNNADIIWDNGGGTRNGYVFAEMMLGNPNGNANTAYTGLQMIAPTLIVEATGSTALVTNVANSKLNLDYALNSEFQLDGNATITNMNLGGDPSGDFLINGGTTTIAQKAQTGSYTDQIGVHFIINPNGALTDLSYNSLVFTNNSDYIRVQGSMFVYAGGIGTPLINNNGWSNDYIDVNGGTLTYRGATGVTDIFTVPVSIENAGTFKVTSSTNLPGGKLIVQDASNYTFPNGSKESVYLGNAAPAVLLSQKSTLECDDGYYQATGILENTDSSNCTLQVGSNSQGAATIAGGKLEVNYYSGTFPTFNVNAAQLNLSGELDTYINGSTGGSGNCCLLNVTGTTSIQNANLGVGVINTLTNGNLWTIIQDGPGNNIQGDFEKPFLVSPPPPPGTSLNGGVNSTKYNLSY
jgi:hypothetical protein